MDGFGDSKSRNKHFKKHVLGTPPNAFGAGDMKGQFPSAPAYEHAGTSMFSQPTALGGMVHIPPHPAPTDPRQAMAMRWNPANNQFATGDPATRRLATFHTRTPDQFLQAVSQQRPDVLPRTIAFEKS